MRRPDLPPAVNQVLTRALSKTPENRYRSCRDFADALRDALRLAPYFSLDSAPAADHPRTGVAPPEPRFHGPDLAGTGKAAVSTGPAAAATIHAATMTCARRRVIATGQRVRSDPGSGDGALSAPQPRHRTVAAPAPGLPGSGAIAPRDSARRRGPCRCGSCSLRPGRFPRSPERQHHSPAGRNITSYGVMIAESTLSNDTYKYQRKYPQGPNTPR